MIEERQIDSNRIAINTLMLYIRMFIVMGVSIYTSRIVLDALGVVDYGIYNVVGGVVTMLGFLNSSMSNAVQRFLSFELGRGDTEKVANIFSTSMIAHLLISVAVVCLAESIGLWFLENKMNIPPERMYAAHWVFQCTIITTVISFFQVPYNAIIIAKEKMTVYAYVSILEVVLRLLIVYMLVVANYDKLIFYAILQMTVSILTMAVYRIYCIRNFSEAKYKRVKDFGLLKKISGFAVWNLVGEFSWAAASGGVNIILNLFCGPVVNAARGLAEQVNGAVSRFVSNFQTAINPQVVKSYAVDQNREMEVLVGRGSRFSYYLLLFLTIPLIFEMDFVLDLWLKDVPEYTAVFCQLILVSSLISIITNLLVQVIRATGKIKKYQSTTAIIQFLNFPLSYIFLKVGCGPVITSVIFILAQIIIGILRIVFVKKMVGYNIYGFLKNDVIPMLKVTVLSVLVPFIEVLLLGDGTVRFLTVLTTSIIITTINVLYIGMQCNEREKIYNFIKTKFHRL